MTTDAYTEEILEQQLSEPGGQCEPGAAQVDRRGFIQLLGAGLLVTVGGGASFARRSSSRSRGPSRISARLHINKDGTITVMTGKVEEGQGARTQITQAAAEELRVGVEQIRLVMADTGLVPDDGITAGSRTTPSTVPSVRRACATARGLLRDMAAKRWGVDGKTLEVRNGGIMHPPTKRKMTYADLAKSDNIDEVFKQGVAPDVAVRAVDEWEVLGTGAGRPNRRDLVTGGHRYPSDIARPNMLYGKILRPPSYGATLQAIDLSKAEAMKDVVVVRDDQFVGFAAPSSFLAAQAMEAAAGTASWKTVPGISSKELFSHLKKNARAGGGSRWGRSRGGGRGDIEKGLAEANKVLEATYEIAYVQHTPMEPRAAVAEWNQGNLTVWAGVDGPHRVRGDLARTFGLASDRVRVIVPDMGGGFGGKHSGEAAVEAARLAKAAGRPVSLRWTRAEEFTWAYFRPAGVIPIKAGLDKKGSLVAWDFTNINSGGSAIDPPYRIPNVKTQSQGSDSPLRQGSYRCLAATANNFARESFMDELAEAARSDPLAFRLEHIENSRLRAVLEAAAKKFDWQRSKKKTGANIGVGLACGTEKGSYVAACAEVSVDRRRGKIKVTRVCEAFECGAIQNPWNLLSQVQGCIMMGMGPALGEEMRFEDGRILNADLGSYRVPRFEDLPEIDVVLLDRRDLESVGGGETPIIAIAPAIANAVFDAAGVRIRSMPLHGEQLKRS